MKTFKLPAAVLAASRSPGVTSEEIAEGTGLSVMTVNRARANEVCHRTTGILIEQFLRANGYLRKETAK